MHAFTGGNDGGGLWSSLVRDKKGNLYGTTSGDGAYGGGTVYRLTQQANGKWTETVLHNFILNKDGGAPFGGPTLDTAGNLYGTTCCGGGPYTYGTVFKLTSGSSGWKETVIHRFGRHDWAGAPDAALVMDHEGSLYGGAGAAFELSPGAGGWREKILHKFPAFNGDGFGATGIMLDAAGNLYGTAEYGGNPTCPLGCGIVYELQRMANGKWREMVLHEFGEFTGDGSKPIGGTVIADGTGNLYGTTSQGGTHVCFAGCGTVYKLTRQSDGRWKETIVYDFRDGASGNGPGAGVVMDKKGNLYGTTVYGGSPQCGCGVVYELSPSSNGKWKYTVLHTFTGNDGAQPAANLILDSKGNLYGTTATGGAGGAGVAFELTP